ncbi:MAG: penicillin acylase family protein [Chloroflexi bacterium]|nr:penicillin acylase family protein [Chloroflexota bacterium]
MRRKKLLQIALIVFIVVVLSTGGLAGYVGYSLYFSPLPETSGRQRVAGLRDNVSVYRDSWAIPQIYATNVDDLFFAQGYVHAQERWWQMELARYLGMGRLSEIFTGNATAQRADRLMLTLDWAGAAQNMWEHASPQTRVTVEAFSRGINAYIGERQVHDLASEYGLLGLSGQYDRLLDYLRSETQVDPWEPYHTFMLALMFGWEMSGNLQDELAGLEASPPLNGPELTSLPPFDETVSTVLKVSDLNLAGTEAPLILPTTPLPALWPADPEALLGYSLLRASDFQSFLATLGLQVNLGGNSWVVNGDYTASGKPLLANDIHMAPEIPSPWFEMGLFCVTPSDSCPYVVSGLSLPGIPGIIVGHNERIAWGINPLPVDTQDVYLLRLDPSNPLHYLVDGESIPLQRSTTPITTEDRENPIEHTRYQSQYGPVITDIEALQASKNDEQIDEVAALHWAPSAYNSTFLDAVLMLNQAQGWDEFRAALRDWNWPAQGFVYADVDNNIGYQVAGGIPIRHSKHDGQSPVPGWDSTYRWRGFVPFELLPSVLNPERGWIIDADNPVVPPTYEAWVVQTLINADDKYRDGSIHVSFGSQWASAQRTQKIEDLLAAIHKHTVESFAQIQGNNHNTYGQEVLPYLIALNFDTRREQDALDWLKEWDLQNHVDSGQAGLFNVFWLGLLQACFADQVGPANLNQAQYTSLLLSILDEPDSPWWDDITTPNYQETRDEILMSAFSVALDLLVDSLGDELEEWRWGDIHGGRFTSAIIGERAFLNTDLAINTGPFPINRGPYDISGGPGSINTTQFIRGKDVEVDILQLTAVPSYRVIINLDDFNHSRAMHTTGQSGHAASEHYDDMIVPWRTIEYHDVLWGVDTIRQQTNKHLDLRP